MLAVPSSLEVEREMGTSVDAKGCTPKSKKIVLLVQMGQFFVFCALVLQCSFFLHKTEV
jgi:hypothetical protein